MNGHQDLFTSQLAREFDEHVLVSIRESVLAAIAIHLRFAEDAYSNKMIKKIATSDCMYLAVMQGAHDALSDSNVPYELKTTQPKGGIYPVINLPSFTIVPRRSNTLEAYRKANYLKDFAIQNEFYGPKNLDLFKELEELDFKNEKTIFMILDVCVDAENNVYFNFMLPSSDLKYIHMNIPYESVLDTYRSTEYDDIEPVAATAVLKATLKDLDRKFGQ